MIQLVQGGRPEAQWAADVQGLSAKDLAMQIVLPELDGRIGGIRFVSLRIPFPPPGSRIERHRSKPLVDQPREVVHEWYAAPSARLSQQCGER